MNQQPHRDPSDPLSERDHVNMDSFLNAVLEDHASGKLTKVDALNCLTHVMTALAIGNVGEARNWFEQGRKFIRQT